MDRLTGTLIGNVSSLVSESLSGSKDFLLLISPFIKKDALEQLLEGLNGKPSKLIVIARWKRDDLLTGVSDVGVYELVKSYGGEMFINSDIHLKIYISDYKTVLIGSANLTQKGLGFSEKHNIEGITQIEYNEEILSQLDPILDSSIKLTDELVAMFAEMVEKFSEEFKRPKSEGLSEFYSKIKDAMVSKGESGLFVHNFPLTSSPTEFLATIQSGEKTDLVENDIKLFMCNTKEELQKAFLISKAYMWQKENIIGPTLFGKYSELLHNSLSDVPTPYRKVVKDIVANMYSWTKEFSDEFEFERMNHTEMIKLK